ncbi:hypothetical protein EUBVEN_00565 [Eubacterium ventriosum ATCC 27560]|uniref:Uncharacterized protein n=1 Tax=Eubacterium ventriosum ATCC 27560 TaxID=411463 RepID=A5Z4E0_9FIRM|nr:hypothetical protein EUBVEN_00565 [Eubacterium ventriosum ATCC 27560]
MVNSYTFLPLLSNTLYLAPGSSILVSDAIFENSIFVVSSFIDTFWISPVSETVNSTLSAVTNPSAGLFSVNTYVFPTAYLPSTMCLYFVEVHCSITSPVSLSVTSSSQPGTSFSPVMFVFENSTFVVSSYITTLFGLVSIYSSPFFTNTCVLY